MDLPEQPDRRIKAAIVRELCGGVSDMSLWRWLHERDFPKPVYIGRRRFWKESEILEWLDAQPQQAA